MKIWKTIENGDMKYERKEHGHYKGKSPKQGLTSAEDLTMELREGRESPYHRLN